MAPFDSRRDRALLLGRLLERETAILWRCVRSSQFFPALDTRELGLRIWTYLLEELEMVWQDIEMSIQ